jgi:hypothetical protein
MTISIKRILPVIISITSFPSFLFVLCLLAMIMEMIGIGPISGIGSFLLDDPRGIIIMVLSGMSSVLFCVSFVSRIVLIERLKRIRYRIAAYLVYGKISSGKKIPLDRLSSMLDEPVRDIMVALSVMIDRKEIKGRIDQVKGSYKHNSVTKRGSRLIMFLNADEMNSIRSRIKERKKE